MIDKNHLVEISRDFYKVQSFTDFDSLQHAYLGKKLGRLFCYVSTDELKILDLSDSIEDRINSSILFTKAILGEDYSNIDCIKDDIEVCCYKDSCSVYTLNESIINFFLELLDIDGLKRIDGCKDIKADEYINCGIEYLLFKNEKLN